MVDFLSTNLNNILAYVGIIIVAVFQLLDIFRNKKSASILTLSLKEYVKRNTKEQNDTVSQTIETFQTTAFRQLADEIITLRDVIAQNKQEAQKAMSAYNKTIEEQQNRIAQLQQSLADASLRITELDTRMYTEADINQQRYTKLKKKES